MLEAQRLDAILERYEYLTDALGRPETLANPGQLALVAREQANLVPIVEAIVAYRKMAEERAELRILLTTEKDPEMVGLIREEWSRLESHLEDAETHLREHLIPKDPADARDVIIEIRAGTGGDEAALFAGDLYRLYTRYADTLGFKSELFDASEGTMGGFKEVVFSVRGNGAYAAFKYESGVHRVQRIPATESQGRVHTSAATVAVLSEAEEVDLNIHPGDLRIDVYRASGAGGQHVNRTESAVRITHLPTGVVAACQEERSQLQNKEKAMRLLRAKLFEAEQERLHAERDAVRRAMVSTGDRSAKIRTYNFPQDRVTDHRLEGDQKNHPLRGILEGHLKPLVDALTAQDRAEKLASG